MSESTAKKSSAPFIVSIALAVLLVGGLLYVSSLNELPPYLTEEEKEALIELVELESQQEIYLVLSQNADEVLRQMILRQEKLAPTEQFLTAKEASELLRLLESIKAEKEYVLEPHELAVPQSVLFRASQGDVQQAQAWTEILAGRYQQAIEQNLDIASLVPEVAQVVQGYPTLYDAQVLYGQILLYEGREQEAIDPLETALRLQAMNPELHRLLGTLIYRVKDLQKAESIYRLALEGMAEVPRKAEIYGMLGKVLELQGKHEQAVTYYDLAIKLDRSQFGIAWARASLAEKMGDMDIALNTYSQVIPFVPESLKDDALARRLRFLARNGRVAEAKDHAQELWLSEPYSIPYTLAVADCYRAEDSHASAYGFYQNAIQIVTQKGYSDVLNPLDPNENQRNYLRGLITLHEQALQIAQKLDDAIEIQKQQNRLSALRGEIDSLH